MANSRAKSIWSTLATPARSFGRLVWRVAKIRPVWMTAVVLASGLLGYVLYVNHLVTSQFTGRRWDLPAHVYARPVELYPGLPVSMEGLVAELRRLGYRPVGDVPNLPGTFRRGTDNIELISRPFRFWDGEQGALRIEATLDAQGVAELRGPGGTSLPVARLDPLLIGSVFPVDGEDRIILAPGDVPPAIPAALKAVEDRRFEEHIGIDPIAVARAIFVNLRSGGMRQGASTLTQQLVRSYFLSNERTMSRKLREALMSVLLELHYSKADILNAYVNEIYLGQDGSRAIHGFGLASEFYFSKPLSELQLHEVATLVAIVRGPSYYDPRRHPDRVRARRDLVLKVMADEHVVRPEDARRAAARDLGIVLDSTAGATYFPAFMALVHRELTSHYREDDLTTEGLRIFTSLDPLLQSKAEASIASGTKRLRREGKPELEGAAVVVNPQNGELLAIVGGRRAGFEGYNRALDAKRPIGSLVKPVVYLAALQSGRTLATPLDDIPISVKIRGQKPWEPSNYDKTPHGTVPLVRALAESMNLATVHLGLDVGVPKVAKLLEKLGANVAPAPNPSVLLGAVDLSPVEVAQIYVSLASGGFRNPLKAVRSVQGPDGEPLAQYPIQTDQVADAGAIYELNEAMIQVMQRGTARGARSRLPANVVLAGKTGTSDDLRDSWFAGYSQDVLAVVWVGYDDNQPTGLTGASGALQIWTELMRGLPLQSYEAARPEGFEDLTIDYNSGLGATASCGDPLTIAVPAGTTVPPLPDCESALPSLANKALQWFRDLTQ
jgi:penicillin-binding protein 1B